MKKMISIVMAFVTAIAIAVEFPQVVIQREAIKNSQHLFYQNRWGTVAFLGGSITEMNGYRPLVMEALKKRFPKANLKCINAGISSTCSDTGAFRLETDVLLKDNIVPDLLFVEYAVNDDQDGFAVTTEDKEVVALRARRSMEGIIRHARMANPNMDIVMVLFVNSRQLKMIQAGKMPLSYAEHLKVAEYYGIPTINVGSALAKGIAEGAWTWKKYRDCHPSPEGNKMVAEKVECLLNKEWDKVSPKIIAHKMPEPMDENAYCCGRFLPISEVKIGEGWNKSVPDWANIKGTVRDNCKKDVILWSTTPGATCEFEFTGNAFGVYVLAGPDAGVIEASVDGKEFKEYALTTPYSSFHYPYTKVLEDGLEKGKHKVTLRVSKKAGPNGGTAVRIFRVCINGTYDSFFNVLCPKHRSAAEQMMLFNSEAAKRFLADMKGNPKYDYAKYAPKIEALIAKENEVRMTLGNEAYQIARQEVGARWGRKIPKNVKVMPVAEAVKLVADYREAMLANPILDFEKLLCVRRQIPRPRTPIGGKACGFLNINAHNHFDLWYKGIQNDIVAISDFKTTNPKYESLYEPKEPSIVKDIELDYDASRILFTGWRGTNRLYGVYEIPVTGSKTPTEVSPSKHKDISWWDACYLPNKDQVIFLGTAAYQFLPCEDGNMAMAVIYRYDRKTGEIRQLTYEQDSDYMPSITHDGRILYTRWEYSDIPHYFSRILMTMNPDGIGQLALWGSGSMMPTFFGCARCVPNDPHKITMYGGGHHEAGEVGRMFMIDPTLARAYPFRYDPPDREWGPIKHVLRIPAVNYPKEKTGMVHEFPGYGKVVEGDVCDPYSMNQFARKKPYFTHPYPLSDKYHLVTLKTYKDGLMGVYLVDTFDNMTLIAEIEDGLLCEPMPIASRKRPPVIPDRSVKGEKNCSVHIADIYVGQGLRGVPRGTVKKLRLFSYHYNYHNTGGHSKVGLDRVESSWDIKRVLGTVDVEEDGSVCFEMPANTPISIQPLDENGAAVQLMRSWVVGMPGERVSCTGCHEDNRMSVNTKPTIADKKYHQGIIQKIKPVDADGIRPWGFEAEAWPIVQKYCLSCHGDPAKAPMAKADQGGCDEKDSTKLSGRRLAMPNAEEAYRILHPYVRRPGPETDATVLTPLDWHVSTSPLIQMLEKGHYGVKVSPEDMKVFYTWIDLNAPYYGCWNPRSFKTDAYLPGTDDQIKRRLELQIEYANVYDNPEKEYNDYLAKVKARKIEPVKFEKPAKFEKPCEKKLREIRFPARDDREAYALCAGGARDLAPVLLKVVDIGNGQSITFRRIPAGTYPMGSITGYRNEGPVKFVTIDKPFWMSETEICNEQFYAFNPNHDSLYQKAFGKDHSYPGWIGNHRKMPVVRVSWEEANQFCEWFSKKTGMKATLPTEEQWEWAARAGTMTPFPWGGLDDDFSKNANFADKDTRWAATGFQGGGAVQSRFPLKIWQNFPLHEERWTDDWFTINYVRRARPNMWGLYDMHGNAAEWTSSAYDSARKTIRGGSFASRPRDGTSSWRWGYLPWQKVYDVGFRIIMEIDEE